MLKETYDRNFVNTGLTEAQVIESRLKHGSNVLTPKEKPSLWRKFLGYFADPLIRILLVALVLSFGISIYELLDGVRGLDVLFEPLGILIAVILATVIGFALEVNADRKFEILNAVNDDMLTKVVRDGSVRQIARRDVVVGDLVIIDAGDEVPADGTLLDSIGLAINESSLTGEPRVRKSHRPEADDPDATYPTNHALRGTTVTEGRGRMVVTAVGDATEYGRVFEAAKIESGVATPLTLQLQRLGKLIAWLSYGMGAMIIIGRLLIFDPAGLTTMQIIDYMINTVMIAITLIVVSVPEGLPMSVTLSLALSMRRMLATNNLVRHLHACETMGATTVICTDKTGTLTINRMSVAQALSFVPDNERWHNILDEGIAVNSTAFLETPTDSIGTPGVIGNPTEGALLLWLRQHNVDYISLREAAAVTARIPFSSERKFMATAIDSPLQATRMLYVKGAPEIVAAMCRPLSDADRKCFDSFMAENQAKAMRTLAVAAAVLPPDGPDAIDGDTIASGVDLQLCSLFAIADPVRDDVPAALTACRDAGIDVKIITGDTTGTAREIGRQTGLWSDADSPESIITGPEWAALSDEEALRRAPGIKIISRARPADKSRMVQTLQQLDQVVAVTGDGTNDAPALNSAHVGLAMGDGTSVAKEAGDIIILDNSFASITKAVMWGRSLYQNIKRFILFQLIVNLVACIIVVLGAFTGVQSPLSVTQMLWVNLIMDTFAALALASLPPSPDVMRDKPRRPGDFIINGAMARNILFTGTLFTVLLYTLLQYLRIHPIDSLMDFNIVTYFKSLFHTSPNLLTDYDLTIFFTAFVALQAWNLLNARSFGSRHTFLHDARHSKVFFATLTVIVVGQIFIVYVGGEMMNVVPLHPLDFILIFAVTSPIALLPAIARLFTARK